MSDKPHPCDVECPTCFAWIGWACQGRRYGYHAAGYHRARRQAVKHPVPTKDDK